MSRERDRLAAGLLIDTNLFDSSELLVDAIVQTYAELPIDHIWLWLSDNEEVDMTMIPGEVTPEKITVPPEEPMASGDDEPEPVEE